MPTSILLDSGPLGLLAHGRSAQWTPIRDWLAEQASARATIYVSEVADVETCCKSCGRMQDNEDVRLQALPLLMRML